MLTSLKLIQNRLLDQVKTTHYRFIYNHFSLDSRLTGLIGPRGVGKTTLLIQYLKNHPDLLPKTLYFSADHIYFSHSTLYEFIEELYLSAGTKLFFIDEIHKYKNWSQELKNLYDGFPSITIVFSGSSSLDLVKGSYDLSRRVTLQRLPGMSFREYLNFSENLQIDSVNYKQLLSGKHRLEEVITRVEGIKGIFQKYLRQGYYPFSIDEPKDFDQKLHRVIEKTIQEDIANYYNLKTENLHLFKKILVFLASIPPGKVSAHNIAKNLSINDHTVSNYLQILQETGLIQMIYPFEGGNVRLRKPEKIFLNNTNIQYALENDFGKKVEIGTIRELMFIQMLLSTGENIFFSRTGDYRIDDIIFEIGGTNKTSKQVKSISNAILVKDQLVSMGRNVIPLIYFGFLY